MGTVEVHTRVWCWNLKESYHFEDVGLDRWIILKWVFRKLVGIGGSPIGMI
jgi:hypothetical protein